MDPTPSDEKEGGVGEEEGGYLEEEHRYLVYSFLSSGRQSEGCKQIKE